MNKIEFFFDCSSPWTYLAFHGFQEIIKNNDNIEIEWKPILVGGVFNSVNQDIYETRKNPNPLKFRYSRKDLRDWSNFYNISINWPDLFPLNAVNVMRGVIVADKYNKLVPFSYSCFEMYWSKGLDISDLDILSEIAVTNGIDKDIFINEIQTKLIKYQLRKNTDNLRERGGFGSPTIFIHEDDMYFGNDRLQLVKEKILGNF